ncbi:MAG: universal stress protein [Cyanobacteria bacterium REEB67]|nr:universal stress protein [Cyanobacteria bacterium REEB67]
MNIIIAVDSSRSADEVLHEVGERTWSKNTCFYIVTCIESCHNWDAEKQFLHEGELILNQRISDLKKRLPDNVITGSVCESGAAEAIFKAATEHKAHLIILGSHGDTGARKQGIGSVAAAVVNQAPCSVEIIKIRQAKPTENTPKLLTSSQKTAH